MLCYKLTHTISNKQWFNLILSNKLQPYTFHKATTSSICISDVLSQIAVNGEKEEWEMRSERNEKWVKWETRNERNENSVAAASGRCRLTGQTDGRTDGRTDTQPLRRPYTDYESGSVNLAWQRWTLRAWHTGQSLVSFLRAPTFNHCSLSSSVHSMLPY